MTMPLVIPMLTLGWHVPVSQKSVVVVGGDVLVVVGSTVLVVVGVKVVAVDAVVDVVVDAVVVVDVDVVVAHIAHVSLYSVKSYVVS